jgi:virginiamycin B lyase
MPGPATATGETTTASQPAITEFPLSRESLFPGGIVQGPDGNLWFLVTKGQPGKTAGEMQLRSVIDRITPTGQITEFALPPGTQTWSEQPVDLTSGPENSIWYLRYDRLGRVSMDGSVTQLPITGPNGQGGLTAGPEGNLWYTSSKAINGQPLFYFLGRTSPNEDTQEFPIGSDVGLWGITTGPDNAIWFTESFTKKIGRITPDGQITQFSVPYSPNGDIVSMGGMLWFTSNGGLGSLTTEGAAEFIKTDVFRPTLSAGGEGGGLWFVREPGVLGHLTSAGVLIEVHLPDKRNVYRLSAGPEGAIWYTAEGQPPYEGGGGTCMATIYNEPGVVGRIVPRKLPIEMLGASRVTSSGKFRVRVRCIGGNDENICNGRLRIGRGGAVVAQRRFVATVGKTRVLALHIRRSARLAILRTGRLRVSATTQTVGGDKARRQLTLRRS